MKGDFTRVTFRKYKHYRKVNMQQGRVQLDGDWNEQNDIQFHYEQKYLHDLIGKNGTLIDNNGFSILPNFSFLWNEIGTNARENARLKKFLKDNFDLLWITDDLVFNKTGDILSISSADGSHSSTITRAPDKATLAVDGKVVYEFFHSGDGVPYTHGYMIGAPNYYIDGILAENEFDVEATRQTALRMNEGVQFFLFEWDTVPGEGEQSLVNFLRKQITAPWLNDDLVFNKTSDDVINISSGPNSAADIHLDIVNKKATLQVDSEMIEFAAKTEDEEIKIYYTVRNPALPARPIADMYYLAYIDVWEHHITHLEDPYIREQALGDIDTATRTEIAWQVKLHDIGLEYNGKCNLWSSTLDSINQKTTTGKMKARAKPSAESADTCSLYETAGYTRLENQLYRLEVHDSGDLAHATFKCSRDNGSVVSKVIEFKPMENKIIIEKRGKDRLLDFAKDQWVEVTDDLREQLGIPGSLVKLNDVKGNTLEYEPETNKGDPINEANFSLNSKVRRWESTNGDDEPLITASTTKDADGYMELEDGIQIHLSVGQFMTGDYWLIPARTRSGDVEWPRVGSSATDEPMPLPPAGIEHHYAPLAVVKHKTSGMFEVVEDLRSFFSSMTEMIAIHYAGGDGQEALTDNRLPAPLRVAVTLGRTPISNTPLAKAKVRFTIVKPSAPPLGELRSVPDNTVHDTSVDVPTNSEGIAECEWTLGEGQLEHQMQQVKAELLDECDNETDLHPLYFNATLPLSFYYVSGDGVEASAGNKVDLAAGVMIGKKPVTSGYKVRFTVTPGGGNLVPGEAILNGNGIATSTYTLSSAAKQQVRADLLFANGTATNIPPIYFNVELLAQSSANTGIAVLPIPEGEKQFPLSFGPFKHFLNVEVPPAVLLGMPGQTAGSAMVVLFMEDYFLHGNKRYFKPVNITTTTFEIEFSITGNEGGVIPSKVLLRWWAVPAQEQQQWRRQEGHLIKEPTVSFDRPGNPPIYNRVDSAIITVEDPTLPVDSISGTVKAFIATDEFPNGIPVTLRETEPQTNVYKVEIKINASDHLIVENGIEKSLEGLKPGAKIYAIYRYGPDSLKSVSAEAMIKQQQ